MIKKIKLYLIVFFILSLAACGEGGNSVDCIVKRDMVLRFVPYLQDTGKLFIGDKYYRFEQKVPTSDEDVESWLDDYVEDYLGDDFDVLDELEVYTKLYERITKNNFDLEEWIIRTERKGVDTIQEVFFPAVIKLVKKEFIESKGFDDLGVLFDTKKKSVRGRIYENAEVTWGENEIVMTWERGIIKNEEKRYITIHLPGSEVIKKFTFNYLIYEGKPDLAKDFQKLYDSKTIIGCDLKVEESSTEKPKKTTPEKTKKTLPEKTKKAPPEKTKKAPPEKTKKAPSEKTGIIPRRN